MSEMLEIIDLDRHGLAAPSTIYELADILKARFDDKPGPNAKFVELARRITALYPSPEAVGRSDDPDAEASIWPNDPVKEAERAGAVWNLGLPPQGGSKLLCDLVKEGTDVGLTMLADSLGLAFLPDGQVLPRERQKQWEAFAAQAAASQRPTLGQMRKKMRALFAQRLAPYGFVPLPTPRGFSIKYHRPVEEGWQRVTLMVEDRHDQFQARVVLDGQCAPVHNILTAALGPDVQLRERDYSFELAMIDYDTKSTFYLQPEAQIEELFDWLTHRALPLLDKARTVRGLDRYYSEMPKDGQWRDVPIDSFAALICAHLTGNACFSELEQRLRAQVKFNDHNRNSDMRTEHLDRLLVYLREHVKPLAD